MIRAYQSVGFTPDRDYSYLEINQFLRRLHPAIVGHTERMIDNIGGTVERDPATDLLTINREFRVCLALSRCKYLDSGRRRWKIRFDTSLAPDITVAVGLDDTNAQLNSAIAGSDSFWSNSQKGIIFECWPMNLTQIL